MVGVLQSETTVVSTGFTAFEHWDPNLQEGHSIFRDFDTEQYWAFFVDPNSATVTFQNILKLTLEIS